MAEISLHDALTAYLKKPQDPTAPETDTSPPPPSENENEEAKGGLSDAKIEEIRAPLLNELHQLINAMPDKEKYAQQPGFESSANKGRFEKYLDHKQALIYKRTDTWDRHPIEVGLLIPKGIDWSRNVGIMVKWHGGALGGSRWDFEPWFGIHLLTLAAESNAIILAPNYRLMPTASGADILSDVSDFWDWFRASCYPPSSSPIASTPIPNLDPTRLIISGDSAGGFLALYSWLRYTSGISIRALYLAYPMVAHYHWPVAKATQDGEVFETVYRGCALSATQSQAFESDIATWLARRRAEGKLPAVSARTPPDGSASNAHLGITGRWKNHFQAGKEIMDIPELVADMMARGEKPETLPEMWWHHGWDDTQCAYEETQDLMMALGKWYEGKSDRLYLTKVMGLGGDGTGPVGHGYDHDLEVKWENEEEEMEIKEIEEKGLNKGKVLDWLERTMVGVRWSWSVDWKESKGVD